MYVVVAALVGVSAFIIPGLMLILALAALTRRASLAGSPARSATAKYSNSATLLVHMAVSPGRVRSWKSAPEWFPDVAAEVAHAGNQGRFSLDLDFSVADPTSPADTVLLHLVNDIDGTTIGPFTYGVTERRGKWSLTIQSPFGTGESTLSNKLDVSPPHGSNLFAAAGLRCRSMPPTASQPCRSFR